MLKLNLDAIDYIANGDPISAAALNKPSVDLAQNTSELKSKIEAYTTEQDYTLSLRARLVNTTDPSGTGVLSIGGYTSEGTTFYDLKLLAYTDEVGHSQSQIEIYSASNNSSRIIVKNSHVSDYFNGYDNLPLLKGRFLSKNGDSIAVRVPRQAVSTDAGLGNIRPSFSNDNNDETYSGITQDSFKLVKLPILNKIVLNSGYLFSQLQSAFSAEYSDAYKLELDSSGVPIISTNAPTPVVQAKFLYASVSTSLRYGKISKIELSSGSIASIHLDMDHISLPYNYQESLANGKELFISCDLAPDSGQSYRDVKAYLESTACHIPTSALSTDHVYIPIITKSSDSLLLLDNMVGPVMLEDLITSSYLLSTRISYIDGFKAPNLDGTSFKVSTVISNPNTLGQLLLPTDIAKAIRYKQAHISKNQLKYLYLYLTSIKIRPRVRFSVSVGKMPSLLFRDSDPIDGTYKNLTVPLEIKVSQPSENNKYIEILPSGSYYADMSDAETIAKLSASEVLSILDVELSDLTRSSDSPAGTSPLCASDAVLTNQIYHIEVEAEFRLIYQ